jgi:uncharacterized protein (TIGR02271 family)
MSDNQRLREDLEAGTETRYEGKKVLDANGDDMGVVIDHSETERYLVVEKGTFFTKDLYIPYDNITTMDSQGVHLNLGKDDFNDKKWQDAPDHSSTPTSYAPSASDGQDQQAATGATMTAQVPPRVQEVQTAQPMQAPQSAQAPRTTDTGDVRVPVYEEELVAGKREEELGRVRVHKEVETEQESIPVTLRREEITVERVPVNQDIDAGATRDAFQGADIEVPVMGEEAVAGKQVREVEELRLRKQEVTEQEQVSGTVRREQVVVDGEDAEGLTIRPS